MSGEGIRPVIVGGWPLAFVASSPDEPRIRDLDLGERLDFGRPRDVRPLIERMENAGLLRDLHVRDTVSRTSMPNGGEREVIVKEYWLTEAQALKVAAKSETGTADLILDDMIHVFRLAVRGELPAQAPTLTRRSALTFLVNEAMAAGLDGAAVAFLNAGRALEKGAQLPLVDIGAPAPAKPVDLAPYRAAVLAAKPAPGGIEGLVKSIPGKTVRVRAAVRELLDEGLLVRTTDTQGRTVIRAVVQTGSLQ